MAYQVLARKHRPQTFDDILGQEAVAVTLRNALTSGKLAHAYLFFGPRGTGKTTTARVLAKALNCVKGPTPLPCLKCDPCTEIAAGGALDVLEMDAATHTQVDKVREVIIETVGLAPARDRYKLFIIDEAHMLSTSAFNALLKTLEEPPAHVVFMLATTEPQKIPATIFSRCQRYRFKPAGQAVVLEYLKKVARLEKIQAEPSALDALARAAGGSMRDAVSLLDQAAAFATGPLKESAVRELLGQLPQERVIAVCKAVLGRDAAALGQALLEAFEEGHDEEALLKELRSVFHRMFLGRQGLEQLEAPWASLAESRAPADFAFLLRRLARGMEEMRGTDQARLVLELTLYGMIEAPFNLREWVARLEALEARLGGGAGQAPAPSAAPPRTQASSPAPASPKRSVGAPGSHASEERAPADAGDAAPRTGEAPAAPAPSASGGPAVETKTAAVEAPPAPVAAMDPTASWPQVVAALRRQRPALTDSLETARFEFRDGRIVLSFVSDFRRSAVQRQLDIVREALAAVAGGAAPVELRQDPDAAPSAAPAAGEAGAADSAAAAEAPGAWREVAKADPLKADPGIQLALKVFPGKVHRVQHNNSAAP